MARASVADTRKALGSTRARHIGAHAKWPLCWNSPRARRNRAQARWPRDGGRRDATTAASSTTRAAALRGRRRELVCWGYRDGKPMREPRWMLRKLRTCKASKRTVGSGREAHVVLAQAPRMRWRARRNGGLAIRCGGNQTQVGRRARRGRSDYSRVHRGGLHEVGPEILKRKDRVVEGAGCETGFCSRFHPTSRSSRWLERC